MFSFQLHLTALLRDYWASILAEYSADIKDAWPQRRAKTLSALLHRRVRKNWQRRSCKQGEKRRNVGEMICNVWRSETERWQVEQGWGDGWSGWGRTAAEQRGLWSLSLIGCFAIRKLGDEDKLALYNSRAWDVLESRRLFLKAAQSLAQRLCEQRGCSCSIPPCTAAYQRKLVFVQWWRWGSFHPLQWDAHERHSEREAFVPGLKLLQPGSETIINALFWLRDTLQYHVIKP